MHVDFDVVVGWNSAVGVILRQVLSFLRRSPSGDAEPGIVVARDSRGGNECGVFLLLSESLEAGLRCGGYERAKQGGGANDPASRIVCIGGSCAFVGLQTGMAG